MKMFKRAAAFCAAVVMSLSVSATAFAAQGDVVSTGSLTVTGDQLAGKEVTAIRMFTARATEGSTSTDFVFDTYELEDSWLDFFKTTIGKDALDAVDGVDFSSSSTDDEYKDAAIKYVASLTNDGQDKGTLADFAEKAQAWARSQSTPETYFGEIITTQKATAASANPGETKGTTTFDSLTPGYYLVYPEMGGTGTNNRNTDAMLINIPTNELNATWNIKSTYPTVEKTVDDGNTATGDGNADNGSAQVGDVVTFTLTSAVPDMSDFTTYVFQFTDKLPEGLTLVNKNDNTAITQNTDFTVDDITLTINGNTVKAENVTVTLADGSDTDVGKKILTVKINNLKAENLLESESVVAGQQIVLTYKAMINENAVTTNPVTNEASVQYSNNPSEETLGTSTPDESTVYTYEIDVHKWSTENGGDSAYLKDAVFALSKESNLGTLSISEAEGDTNGKVINDNGDSVKSSLIGLTGSGNAYMIDPESTVYTFTTNGSAAIKVQGLEVGTYYLYEVNAPSGYNKLKEPVKIEITLQDGDYSKPVYKVTINGETTTGTSGDSTIKVENKKGIELPETGSIGTIGLTVAGVAIVLLGVFAPRKKKKNDQE